MSDQHGLDRLAGRERPGERDEAVERDDLVQRDDRVERDDIRRHARRGQPAMPGPTGPGISTEAVGDPGADDPDAAAQGGAATGAVIGTLIGGPLGTAIGAGLGGAVGAAAGADEAASEADHGGRDVDAAFQGTDEGMPRDPTVPRDRGGGRQR